MLGSISRSGRSKNAVSSPVISYGDMLIASWMPCSYSHVALALHISVAVAEFPPRLQQRGSRFPPTAHSIRLYPYTPLLRYLAWCPFRLLMFISFVLDMLAKSIIALALLSVGYVQAFPFHYAREYFLVANVGCGSRGSYPLCFLDPADDMMHILPYPFHKSGRVPVGTKREPGEVRILPYPHPDEEVHIQPYPYFLGGTAFTTIKREHPKIKDEGVHTLPYPYHPGDDVSITAKRNPQGTYYVSLRSHRPNPINWFPNRPTSKRGLERMPAEQYFSPSADLHMI